MGRYSLRLLEDRLPPGARYGPTLPPLNRVLYVRHGRVTVSDSSGTTEIGRDAAWHGAGFCDASAHREGATVLRWELVAGVPPSTPVGGGAGVQVMPLLAHEIALDAAARYLMRADRVDFDPGGVALPHRHRGGGIRCLLAGALEVTIGDAPPQLMKPGDAWFESGREPVLARERSASPRPPAETPPPATTSFIRISILPAELAGRSSIVYVDPADAARGRPRRSTIYLDDAIELPL